MVLASGRKALEGMGVRLKDAWVGSLGRLGMRSPLLPRKAEVVGLRPGLAVFLAVVSAVAVLAAILYRRKRRQVAEHYNMGGARGVEEPDSASSFAPAAPPGLR